MNYEIVIADPAKNITLFVLTPVPQMERARVGKLLMDDPGLGVEQVGFVLPPSQGAPLLGGVALRRSSPLWRLEMMGGEFCGNAARSFGLYVARRTGLSGQASLEVEISGARTPVKVLVDVEQGLAEASMPPALEEGILLYEKAVLPVYFFEGIVHVIAGDMEASERVFYAIKALLEKRFQEAARSDAVGVMFYDSAARTMTPAVYVRATDTLVFESSCGSGSAALGLDLARNRNSGETILALRQPGGTIKVRVEKLPGKAPSVSIGGPVTLSGPELRP
jgi:diaminopimelate epimerase